MERLNLEVQSQEHSSRKPFFRVLLILGLLLIFFAVYDTSDYFLRNNLAVRQAKSATRSKMHLAIQKMNVDFAKLQGIVARYMNLFNQNRYSGEEIIRMAKEIVEQNHEIYGFAVAFEPYQYNRGKRLFAPYCNRKNNVINLIQVEDSYDYTSEKTPGLYWYQKPLQQGTVWSEPFFSNVSGTLVVACGAPFYGPGQHTERAKPIGVVTLIYSLSGVRQLTQSLGLQGNGYACILSRQGFFITHPDEEKTKEHRNIFDEAILRGNSGNREQIREALDGKSEIVDVRNKSTGQDSWLFLEPIGATGYVMAAEFIKSSVVNHKDFTRRRFIAISLLLISGVFLLLFIMLNHEKLSTRTLWMTSVLSAVLLIGEIFFIWNLALKYHNYYRPNTTKVVDELMLNDFLAVKGAQAKKRHEAAAVFIRTGVFVQSLEFKSANDVKLTGYIWQKFDKQSPVNVTEGFVLPETVESTIEEAYRREVNGVRTVGWHFEAVLRQSFEYFKYPLDNKDVWIRVWPKDFDQNVILIPDLAAYTRTDPNALPGVERDFVIPGWRMTQSFFSFVPNSYNMNFGIDNYSSRADFPELYYSVLIERNFLNAFIANLLPFTVIALVLFAMTLLISYTEEKVAKFQASIGGTLAGCAGLIFSVIIAHNQLRSSIEADGVLYMEYFYLALYIAIVLVIINAFLVAFDSKLKLVRYRDNLWPKILIWPLILTGLLVLTAVTFY